MNCRGVLLLTVALPLATTHAYEIGTHAVVSEAAFNRSVLADSLFVKERLGLNIAANNAEPFGNTYYDFTSDQIIARDRTVTTRRTRRPIRFSTRIGTN